MKITSKKRLLHFAFVWLLFCSNVSLGETSKNCGQVAVRVGQARNGKGSVFNEGDRLNPNDRILTGPNSFVKLVLQDNTIVDIGPDSEFVIRQCSIGDPKDLKLDLALDLGRVRVNVNKKIDKTKRDFKFSSPTSVLAVRGTEFYVVWEKNRDGEVFENIALIEGSLEVVNALKKTKEFIKLEPGTELKVVRKEGKQGESYQVDQLTAQEQRLLEEQIKIDTNLEKLPTELPRSVLDALLESSQLPNLELKPLNLFQGSVSLAQQGNYSVFTPVAGGGSGASGGSGTAGGGATGPIFTSSGNLIFKDQ